MRATPWQSAGRACAWSLGFWPGSPDVLTSHVSVFPHDSSGSIELQKSQLVDRQYLRDSEIEKMGCIASSLLYGPVIISGQPLPHAGGYPGALRDPAAASRPGAMADWESVCG